MANVLIFETLGAICFYSNL